MRVAYGLIISTIVSGTLIDATPCMASSLSNISTTSTTITSATMTIAITNIYGAPLSLLFQSNVGFPSQLGDSTPTMLPDSASTQYLYPTGWGGHINIAPNLSPYGSKIEGSFTGPPDVDVSYVDGYSVPITCSSQGTPITGCNHDLFKENTCEHLDGPVCINTAGVWGPPTCFFAPCAGSAYTFPKDDGANVSNLENLISCCIGTLCEAPKRQLEV